MVGDKPSIQPSMAGEKLLKIHIGGKLKSQQKTCIFLLLLSQSPASIMEADFSSYHFQTWLWWSGPIRQLHPRLRPGEGPVMPGDGWCWASCQWWSLPCWQSDGLSSPSMAIATISPPFEETHLPSKTWTKTFKKKDQPALPQLQTDLNFLMAQSCQKF